MVSCVAHAQYRFTQWTADAGLPQNSVRGLVETPDGFLWIATLNGAARFDGVHFQVFDKSNTPGISSSRFTAMIAGSGADLWFVSEDNNLVLLHNGVFRTLDESAGMRPHSIGAITGDSGGGVWVQSDHKVLRWDSKKQQFYHEPFSTEALRFQSMWWVGTGFWAQNGTQLLCFNRGHLKTFAVPAKTEFSQIRGVAMDANDDGWISTSDGRLGRLGGEPAILERQPLTFALEVSPGTHWKVEIDPHRFDRTLHLPIDGVNHTISLNVIFGDAGGNLWVGSERDGLFRIQREFIKMLTSDSGLASNNSYALLRSSAGDLWAGGWPGGLSQIRGGKVLRTFGQADGVPDLVTALAEDRDGSIWIGTHGGVRKLVRGKLVKHPLPFNDKADVAQVIYQAPDGAMLFGTPHGLDIVRGSTLRHLTTADGLATDDVRVIVPDRNGNLWIGGYGGLTLLHDGRFTHWTERDACRVTTSDASWKTRSDRSGWVPTMVESAG